MVMTEVKVKCQGHVNVKVKCVFRRVQQKAITFKFWAKKDHYRSLSVCVLLCSIEVKLLCCFFPRQFNDLFPLFLIFI